MAKVKAFPEVAELLRLMEQYEISVPEVAKILGSGLRSTYNWTNLATAPVPIWREKIRAGVRKIEKQYALPPRQQIRAYWSKVWPKLSNDERDELMKLIGSPEDYPERYLGRLKELAAEKGIKVKIEPPKLPPSLKK